jgi:hypothetical protein
MNLKVAWKDRITQESGYVQIKGVKSYEWLSGHVSALGTSIPNKEFWIEGELEPGKILSREEWEKRSFGERALSLLGAMKKFWGNGTPVHPGSELANSAIKLLESLHLEEGEDA